MTLEKHPVLTVFIDGLKPDNMKYMPFVDSLPIKKRLRTQLGYSNGCHASMYTGVHPDKHNLWLTWRLNRLTSPYAWINRSKLPVLVGENFFVKYACHRITDYLNWGNTSFHGVPFITSTPFSKWHLFDVTEKKYWTEDKFIDNYKTIFEIFRDKRLDYQTVGLEKSTLGETSEVRKYKPEKYSDWTYVFFGDIDGLSHKYGQNTPEVGAELRKIDEIIHSLYSDMQNRNLSPRLLLFSDHGHVKVKKTINVHKLFSDCGLNESDFIYWVDATLIRFWIKKKSDIADIACILNKVDGFLLTDVIKKKYNINMPDNRYGDIIFCLNPHWIFEKPFSPLKKLRGKRWDISSHGYVPEYPDMDGVLISDTPINRESPELVDILPTLLTYFGIVVPEYVGGKSLWD